MAEGGAALLSPGVCGFRGSDTVGTARLYKRDYGSGAGNREKIYPGSRAAGNRLKQKTPISRIVKNIKILDIGVFGLRSLLQGDRMDSDTC